MDIGAPTNVRHVAHVTFDRFNGFLGLPLEFEPEVPRKPPSASTSVFGVSTKSMQLSFDSRGNSVPTILLRMQRRLYMHGGLQAEGIFRINGRNGEEESIREQLNMGLVPDNIDVHCLAGLIKAWFRELPNGVLDSLRPEQIMQAQSEQQCSQLMQMLPPIEAALLDWTINLMADVATMEIFNKMNTRSVALVFAPNMTRMEDPLTALKHAVHVMNFLKTLTEKTLRDREDFLVETDTQSDSDENEGNKPMIGKANENERILIEKEALLDGPPRISRGNSKRETEYEKVAVVNNRGKGKMNYTCAACHGKWAGGAEVNMNINVRKVRFREPTKSSVKRGYRKSNERCLTGENSSSRGGAITGLNSRSQRNEAWR